MKLMTLHVKGTREEALSSLTDRLREHDYVKEPYKESLLLREEKYPTGLALANSVNIAIPHTEPALVNESVFVMGVPDNVIRFRRIDAPSEDVSVDLIFLLVIKDPERYLRFLSGLTQNFENAEFLEQIRHRDTESIRQFLESGVLESA
ncbi:PTS sugar transporter subunit IIA [Candidatus Cryosericum terrychapinii]|uniref:PTS sugar transporter subunit IIA n=1 Tax=Candidatus Cryosericum terrychapinii TaxID=2290919 RepID=A0A398CTR1_9BACT|nr:PTS sugar transporter subunit IIA [Candidatus Cryosericum terrychapinii]RIE06786.1 PTS sugar transporter subunit IIA [Candidatus Cryosericum terrychapinii]